MTERRSREGGCGRWVCTVFFPSVGIEEWGSPLVILKEASVLSFVRVPMRRCLSKSSVTNWVGSFLGSQAGYKREHPVSLCREENRVRAERRNRARYHPRL